MFDFDTAPDRRNTGSLKWNKYAGRDVIPLWVADMDFRSAPAIVDELRARAEHGVFGYTIPHDPPVAETIAYLKRVHGLDVDPDWLVWLPGLVQGLNLVCRAVGESGDGVMTCTPVYPPFLSAPGFSDRQRITVPFALDGDRWVFDWPALGRAVTPRVRLFNLCHPQNPTGRAWRRDELEQVLEFCERHDLAMCSDEIHCDILLDEVKHIPMLSLGERAARRTIVLMSPSKTYNVPGLACAYAIIPNEKLRTAFRRVARGVITEINAFGYAGCAAAYRDGEPWRLAMLDYLRVNRSFVYDFIKKEMPLIRLHPMQATYLAWLDVRELRLENPVKFFEDAGVGLSGGADFGQSGFLRLNFGCPRARLEEGLRRMAKAVSLLRP